MTSTNDIRSTFLDYFGRQGHEIVESSPLVPRNDPTLLFTNAGMVQFKNVFTGVEARPYKRATTSQKCVRAGGKHNDLENVGYTARHHTFFEMLGNFSFGDYFKDRAIELAWNLVTREFALPKERLLVTVYAEDDQAFDLWKKIAGLPDERIIRIATSDNFWAMGDTGPCGPCSEIFYDHGEDIPGGPPGSPDEDGDRFIEIWNLVFMQFEQQTPERRIELPRPSIDTGMGLERIAAVLQGKHDNYDIDLMRALIEASAEASGTDPDGERAVSHRVIADHLRASSFLIADGVLPSNEGRGYVLRRIMRRAMRHAHLLGAREPMMWKLVPALVREMGQHFPELGRAQALIGETLRLEETRFKEMLGRGLKLLEEETGRLPGEAALPGEVAFKLYDTFGFPLDLTQDILRGQGRKVDEAGYQQAMARQRAAARKAWAGSGEAATEAQWFELRERLGATEFLGYDSEVAEGVVTAILLDGQEVQQAPAGSEVAFTVNQTPFYGESGGQQADSGVAIGADRLSVAVRDVQRKLGDLFVHYGTVEHGSLKVGEAVELRVDGVRRAALRAHHSATHLLHEALRRRLGEHVTQKGSLVAPDRLRFDFSHNRPLSAEDLQAIEAEVNARIRLNEAVTTRFMTPQEAIDAGALALFGEKYGDEVRVLSMGGLDEGHKGPGRHYSTELCGGTHVRRVGDIGFFKVVSEQALAAGVRRIEAVTGAAALAHVERQEALLGEAASALRAAPAELPQRIAALLDERKRLERELGELRRKLATGGGDGAATKEINGVTFAAKVVEDVPAKDLKSMADALKKQIGSGVAALVAVSEGKASLVVGVTDDLTGRFSAVDLVRAGSAALGGKGGGGRPDMAQAGGPDGAKAQEAVAAIEAALAG
ncbi:alanyl-tRNA synthetase [Tistlia consotensis]|uniref:Alanine--tRNA ligase n=1 Tax=Tistlia consotensis USBA 355 TaxID=560819 RepID=A0A1Y6CSJ9_9PROT|nr:alanine--tRNA ligase [Tistlia consotensis]SMF85235.1 alanyl-tRNA synthetase [Tistlia consotensis USBA 355]SNR98750.1 alanyl-tRNA synthetase [Tistlia consotensis]